MTDSFQNIPNAEPLQDPHKRYFRKQARRETSALAGLLFCVMALTVALTAGAALLRPLVKLCTVHLLTVLFSMSPSSANLWFETLAASTAWSTFFAMAVELAAFYLPFALYAKYIKHAPFDTAFPVCGGKKIKHLPALFALQALAAMAASLLCNAVGGWIFPDFFAGFAAEETVRMTASDLVVSFLSLCVFTPFVEEFVFRGVIFGSLRRYGFGYAAVASALLFGLAHGSPAQLAYALASGLVFAAVYEVSGSVRTGILLHALNNTISFVFTALLPQFASEEAIETANWIYYLVLGVLAVWGFVYLVRLFTAKKQEEAERIEAAFRADPEKTLEVTLPVPSVPLSTFVSAGTVIYTLLFLFNIYMYRYGI